MKGLKRRLAAVLAVCMVLTGVLPAFADTAEAENLRTVSEVTEYRKATPSDAEDPAVEGTAKDIEKEPEKNDSEKATPSAVKKNAAVLIRETTVDGIRIVLTADPGVFPEEAELWAEKVEDSEIQEAIDKAVHSGKSREEAEKNVASSLKFDIKMLLDGEEIQPDTEAGSATISFALAESIPDDTEINVYHVTGDEENLTAEALETEEEITEVDIDGNTAEGTAITSEITGFSFYVIEFSWGVKKYTMGVGDGSLRLTKLLSDLQIPGELMEAGLYDEKEERFSLERYREEDPSEPADWLITPLKASETPGLLYARTYENKYDISITISDVKRETISYIDTDGINKTNEEADCVILDSCDAYTFMPGAWYAVTGDVTIGSRIENKGTTDNPSHLILTDASKLYAKGGIHSGTEAGIEIYGQTGNAGDLIIDSVPNYYSGLGGNQNESGGSIVIKGGRLTVTGAIFGAGIGGGMNGGIGSIIINGGTINVTGGEAAAGIGSGTSNTTGGSIRITGGTITSKGGRSTTPAIGSGLGSDTMGDLEIDDVTLEIHAGGKIKSSGQYARDRDNYVEIIYGAPYTICHYFQNLERTGYDEPVRELKYGHPGTLTKATKKENEGFKLAHVITQEYIQNDGSTTVDIHYDRIQGIIIFDANGHGTAPNQITAYYGQPVQEPEKPTAAGFVFDGWYEDAACTKPYTFSTIKAAETILFAKWEESNKKYNISWMLTETSEPFDTTVVREGEIPTHDGPILDDRVFIGWEPQPVPAICDTNYVAMFEQRGTKEAVSFNTNGGTYVYTQLVEHDGRAERPEDPTKDGYNFAGWYREASFITPYDFNDSVNTDITLYARWEKIAPVAYTVTWKMDADSIIDTEVVLVGDMPVHADVTKEGYIFTGWTPTLAPVTEDITYTAKFEKRVPERVAVTFNTMGGSYIDTQVINKGTKATKPGADPVKAGYTFQNWYRDASGSVLFDFDTAVNADTIIYAKWTENKKTTHTVTWKMDDGTLINTTKVEAGDMPSHENPTKDGYIFLGWNPDLAPVTGDITYTAQFEQRTPDKAAVTFNTDGGSFIETQVVKKGQTAVRPSNPTKNGYEFANWYTDAGCSLLYDFNTIVTADITLYAKWKKTAGKEYTITFTDWDGKLLAAIQVPEGGLPVYPKANPTRSGYIFTYWDSVITLATCDKTYKATYAKQSTGGGGGGGGGTVSTTVKVTPTFSPNWYSDIYGVWRIRNSAGQTVVNAWLCDDVIKANGQNVWYLLGPDGAMLAAGLVQDNTGNFYSLETEHNGYFGMLRYQNGTYNCNGQQVYLTFNHEHNGSFGAIMNAEGLEKLKQIYGVTQYGIGNENSVYTATF